MRKVASSTAYLATLSVTAVMLLNLSVRGQRQFADPTFRASVKHPAYYRVHPKVVIDEAHANFHTADGRYKPFADLLRSDGYQVARGTKKFHKEGLNGTRILVIANAGTPEAIDSAPEPAFTEQECDVVRDWVREGGSLLLIADHTPSGSAAENLAKRFGVEMGKGYVFDFSNSDGTPTVLIFTKDNGLLGDHPLLRGRNPSEEVKRLVAFTGQSLSVPNGSIPLMKLSGSAYESPTRQELQAALKIVAENKSTHSISHAQSVGGRAQGVAMKFGRGRVVILGEAAMLSAQVVQPREGHLQREVRMGMNVPGSDDKQFALNVLHWLSELLN